MTFSVLFCVFIVASSVGILSHLYFHRKSDKHPTGFWGSQSWVRKYKHCNRIVVKAPNNIYYRLFKIEYKEKFPLSATALVFLTDGFHLLQFIAIHAGIFALSSNWIDFAIYSGLYHLTFNIWFTILKK